MGVGIPVEVSSSSILLMIIFQKKWTAFCRTVSFAQQRNTMRTALQPLLSLIALFKLSRLSYNGVATMTPVMLWVGVIGWWLLHRGMGPAIVREGLLSAAHCQRSRQWRFIGLLDQLTWEGAQTVRISRQMTSIFWGEDDTGWG